MVTTARLPRSHAGWVINAAARRFDVSPMKEKPVDEFHAAVSSVPPISWLPRFMAT
jgi:hypothetical protein